MYSICIVFKKWGGIPMLLDFLIIDLDLYTMMALNVSLYMGLMLSMISTHRIEFGLGTPFSPVTDIQDCESKGFDSNRSLLIQYFIIKRVTKSIRNRVCTGDDSDSIVSLLT